MADDSIIVREISRIQDASIRKVKDSLVVEEPLAISLSVLKTDPPIFNKSISITMRTPGEDSFLALGFLYGEGIIHSMNQVKFIEQAENNVEIFLYNGDDVDLSKLDRHFYTTSSCGICGKTSIDNIRVNTKHKFPKQSLQIDQEHIFNLRDKLKNQQSLFALTGGIHAAALFDHNANIMAVHEDVGRHNALDKLIGKQFQIKSLPLNSEILLLSGRASFELIQKAAMAGIQFIVAVGAPSSLAVELAIEFEITLIGFLGNNKFNVYNGIERINMA